MRTSTLSATRLTLKTLSIRSDWPRDWRSTIFSNSVDVSPSPLSSASSTHSLCWSVAAHLYKKNSRWEGLSFSIRSRRSVADDCVAESITLSKEDKLYKDAIETAATSGIVEVAEDLLSYFVSVLPLLRFVVETDVTACSDIGSRECYAATLFVCYDLIRPDQAQFLSWRSGLNDFTMPCQSPLSPFVLAFQD